MSKFKDSEWTCDRKYATYKILCSTEDHQDCPKKIIVGICPDGTAVMANISAFEGNTDGMDFFYADINREHSGESLKTLEQFAKVHKPPFFIRSLQTSSGSRVFSEEVMRLIPIALREQGEPFDEEIYHRAERSVYKTMSEKEFHEMLTKFDINKGNIRLVPDIDQVYGEEHSDWELPNKVHAPDGKMVMTTCQAVFFIFQRVLCWKREECQKCSHELFEKEVVHCMRTYEMMDSTMFFTLDHIEATFPKMTALLCPDCLQKLPKTLQSPLPDKSPNDKISKEDLEQITEEYGVPEPSEYSRISKIIEEGYCPVWMLRLFMVGGWLRRVFPLMEPKLKECVLGSAHHLVPKYLRSYRDLEEFMDPIMNGFKEKNERFESALAKSKSRAEVLKQRKEIKKKNQGKTTQNAPEVPKLTRNVYSDDDRFFEMVNHFLIEEETVRRIDPEKFNRRIQRMEGPPMKKSRGDELESSEQEHQGQGPSEQVEEAEIVDFEPEERLDVMPKPKDCQVIRHTQYEQITVTGEEQTHFLGKLQDGNMLCSNLDLVQVSSINLVNEFFYINWEATEEMINAGGLAFDKVAKQEEFNKSFHSPKFYVRCLLGDLVFLDDMDRVLRLGKPNQRRTASATLEQAIAKKRDYYMTMPLEILLEQIDQRGIDRSRIVIVPDMTQQHCQETSDWELPYKTLAPDATSVMSIQQAIFHTFQSELFGRGEKCKKKCASNHEKVIIEIMEGYLKERRLSFYIPTERVLANIATANKKLCKPCKTSRAKTPSTKPYPDKDVYDKVPSIQFQKAGRQTGKKICSSEKNVVWEARMMLLLECIFQRSNISSELSSVLSKSVDFLVPYKIRTSDDPSDKVHVSMFSTVVDTTRSLGLEGIPGMARMQFDSAVDASMASLNSMMDNQQEKFKTDEIRDNPKGQPSETKDSKLDAAKELDDNQISSHEKNNTTTSQDETPTSNTVCDCLPDVGDSYGTGFTTRQSRKQTTFLQQLAEVATQRCHEIMSNESTEQEKNEPSKVKDSKLDELKIEMPEHPPEKADLIKKATRLNFKAVIKNPDGSESINKIGSFVLPEGVELYTGQEEVPSSGGAEGDVNAQILKKIAELEKMYTPGTVINEKSIPVKEPFKKYNKEMKQTPQKLETNSNQPRKAIEEQKKSTSHQVQNEPEESVDLPEPSGPVEKKKWIVPKRKRPDAPYKPNRAPKQSLKKVTKPKEEPEVTPPEQPPVPEMPELLEAAPEPIQTAPATPEPLEAALESSGPQQPASATSEPPTPEDDPKAAQLARALEELRLAKLENKSLKIQNQKYEGMEKKVEKMTVEKRNLKESHDLEMKGVRKQHSDLVKYQQETIDGLTRKLADQSQSAGKKVLGATQNWRRDYPKLQEDRRESETMKKQNEKLSLRVKELEFDKEKDTQKIRELESKLAKLTENTTEGLQMKERVNVMRAQNQIKDADIQRLAAELFELLD